MEPQDQGAVPQPQVSQFTPLAAQGAVIGYRDIGWSWGACFFGPVFLVGIRRYSMLWLYILVCVPLVNFIAMPALMIYLGLKGREMARTSRTFASPEEYLGYMKGIDHGAKLYFVFFILFIVVVGIMASAVLASLSTARERARNAQEASQARYMEAQEQWAEEGVQY